MAFWTMFLVAYIGAPPTIGLAARTVPLLKASAVDIAAAMKMFLLAVMTFSCCRFRPALDSDSHGGARRIVSENSRSKALKSMTRDDDFVIAQMTLSGPVARTAPVGWPVGEPPR